MTKRRLLFIGDACVSSGFARSTHYLLASLMDDFDVAVLGINAHGDPHAHPYPIYPASPGGDAFGVGRMKEIIARVGPAVVVVQQDPWNFPFYYEHQGVVPMVGIVAVDGLNCKGSWLNQLALAVFWTGFGEQQARLGGYRGPSVVAPLGVDVGIYHPPTNRMAVRQIMRMPEALRARGLPDDAFVVGAVGRNHLRKRLDLTVQYFAEWIHSYRIADAGLWLHVAPTGDAAYDLEDLARYYGIADRVFVPTIDEEKGIPEETLARVYSVFDVLLTTTQGEGFGLPMIEAMACGTPVIAPEWAALGDWAQPAAYLVPCTSTAMTPNRINVVGGVPDRDETIAALDTLYRDRAARNDYAARGLALANAPRFRWEAIGRTVSEAIQQTLFRGRQHALADPSARLPRAVKMNVPLAVEVAEP